MNESSHYRLLGGPGSPYSLKMRAVLRYRRIPHHWIVPVGYLGEAGELRDAGKGMIPVLQTPEGEYWADSTPMILALEDRFDARSVLPADPGDRFLARLIEDFADEWLVFVVFDYRWSTEEDQAFCARRQIAGWVGAMPAAEFEQVVARMTERQTRLLATMGEQASNRPLYQSTYAEVLEAIEAQLETDRFLFGGRPSIGDFGLYGQLSQLAIDPSASAVMRRQAIRTFQWVQDIDDASGIEGQWRDPGQPHGPGVARLLKLIGEVYLPLLDANATAVANGEAQVRTELRGQPMVIRANPYKARCLGELKLALQQALDDGATSLEATLSQHGCWQALQLKSGEAASIARLSPQTAGRGDGPF